MYIVTEVCKSAVLLIYTVHMFCDGSDAHAYLMPGALRMTAWMSMPGWNERKHGCLWHLESLCTQKTDIIICTSFSQGPSACV